MLIRVNKKNISFFILFLSTFFKVEASNEIRLKHLKLISKETKQIDYNIKNNKYGEKSYFEKSCLRKTNNYFENNEIKKIEEISTNEAENVFKYSYYFLKDIFYIKYEAFTFNKYISIYSLPKNYNNAKKEISEYYFKQGKLIKFIQDGQEIKIREKILENENYIKNRLDKYIFLSKYLNKPNYRDYSGERWGMRKRFPLCGKEKAIKVTYTFNKPFCIEIIDSIGDIISAIEEMSKEDKETTITRIIILPKDKKFDLDSIQVSITSLRKGSKWKLRVEFEE